jgi:hypothetical protein
VPFNLFSHQSVLCKVIFYFLGSSINCQASFIGISHTCNSTNKHHLKNSQKQQQKKRRFWGGNGEGGGCFKNVSRQQHTGAV